MARISSKPLQNYRHNYAKVFMTGLLGCRWHRYKQSTKGSRKRDVGWFMFLILTAMFMISCFYMVLVIKNDELDLNEFLLVNTGSWLNWYTLLLSVIGVLFTYIVILLLLSLCHIVQGHQLFIHPVHLVLLFIVLGTCVALCIVLQELWKEEWTVIYISLQVFGPFLQIGAVCLMTLLSWVISQEWFKLTRLEWKITSVTLYCSCMIGLYISPLFIHSPCVILAENLPNKPKLFAHRGAAAIAPENTVISFETASKYDVYGIETDVRISLDGTAFVMHDSTLGRTTNVDQLYPGRSENYASNFNISDLFQLKTGHWFLKHGPKSVINSLSDEERSKYKKQTIPTFLDVLRLARDKKLAVMFDIFHPEEESHPFYNYTFDIVVDLIAMAGINYSQIYWPSPVGHYKLPPAINKLYENMMLTVGDLRKQNYTGVNFLHSQLDLTQLRSYKEGNISTSVYMVNSAWLYSFYWCLGVDYVSTSYCNILSEQHQPIWHMNPMLYLALWISVDVVSAVLIVSMFFIQRRRLNSNRFKPDQMSLSSSINGHGTWGSKRSRRSMKEKLIMTDLHGDTYDFEPEEDFGIDSNGYEVTVNASDGLALSQAFHSNRTSCHSNTESCYGNGVIENNRHSFVSESHSDNGDVFLNTSHNRLSTGSNIGNGDTGNSSTVTEINFSRNGSVRNSFHDASISSFHSEPDMPETEFKRNACMKSFRSKYKDRGIVN